jgi:heme/copper-type cytochrome/quinol oxidase subunit 4
MAETAAGKSNTTKYLVVYVGLLALAGLQVLMAYNHGEGAQLFVRFLVVALAQGALALIYFMHLGDEKRGLWVTLIPVTIFVLLMMNMIWSDSFRLLHMRPFAQ